jgi:hypothetical protein
MQSIELQNFSPRQQPPQRQQQERVRSYIKDPNPAEKIAGLFYYSSAALLWTAGGLAVIGFLFYSDVILGVLIMSLIFGLPVWVWAGIGAFLFCCHRNYYKFGMEKDHAVWMWLLTAGFNAIQATFIFNLLPDGFVVVKSIVGGWNLIVASLSLFAFYFEMKKA